MFVPGTLSRVLTLTFDRRHRTLFRDSPVTLDVFGTISRDSIKGTIDCDGAGNITNVDDILDDWRHDIVQHTLTEDGGEIVLYDPDTGEYHTRLHEGAEFGIKYEDGYTRNPEPDQSDDDQ